MGSLESDLRKPLLIVPLLSVRFTFRFFYNGPKRRTIASPLSLEDSHRNKMSAGGRGVPGAFAELLTICEKNGNVERFTHLVE
jgi:hypothetical protein